MSTTINQKVGQRVRTARTFEGLTQTELAACLGVQPSTLCNWEMGSRALPPGQVAAICIALGTTADYLFGLSDSIRPAGVKVRRR